MSGYLTQRRKAAKENRKVKTLHEREGSTVSDSDRVTTHQAASMVNEIPGRYRSRF
jgi:hypothetical protein